MLKLVIFDFDGLMVNTEEVVYAAITELLKTYDVEFRWEHFAKYIGLPVDDALSGFMEDLSLPLSFDQFVVQRNTIVERFLEEKLTGMPGLEDVLTLLRKSRIRMAIATSGKRQYVMKYLRKLHIDSYFESIVSIDDVKRGKPHPDLVLKALDVMNCRAEDAIMLEDAPHGIEAARRAGVFTIAVPQPRIDMNQYRHAGCICSSLADVHILMLLMLSEQKSRTDTKTNRNRPTSS